MTPADEAEARDPRSFDDVWFAANKAGRERLEAQLAAANAEIERLMKVCVKHTVQYEHYTRALDAEKVKQYQQFKAQLAAANAENERLRAAIAWHHSQWGNDKCWENDNELYRRTDLEPHFKDELPPIAEHVKNCDAYRCGLYGSDGRTELTALTTRNAELEAEKRQVREQLTEIAAVMECAAAMCTDNIQAKLAMVLAAATECKVRLAAAEQ